MAAVAKIALAIAAIAAVVALNTFAPGIGTFLGISAFMVLMVGTVVIASVFSLLGSFLNKQQAPSADAGSVNVRISEPPRWLNAGVARQGGGVLFAEFDSAGNLWYLVVHSDSILTNTIGRYLDDNLVTVDGSGLVNENDFCLTSKKEPYEGTGTKVKYVQIWTTTYTLDNPVPPVIAPFAAAFPQWTPDHKLVGTTYSVVKIKALDAEHRAKIYKWRGPLGLGEPAFGIVGEWSAPYDPRTDSYGFTRNSALIWAWFRTHRYGRKKAFNSINWDRVAEQADICDENVAGVSGTQKRYECGSAIPDSKERHIAEQEILMSCDAQLVFDDDGKCWPRVGYYYEPTIALSRNRDIVAMESVEATNGESETQGVIVRYIDPESGYIAQPCAPWYNPNYYVPGEATTFLTVDILSVQNHNQAMRLAKAIGMRSQPLHKILPTVGLRGLKARQERIISLNYDNVFSGNYEIATTVEVDEAGLFCGFGAVPVASDRWTLLEGEETAKGGVSAGVAVPLPPLPTGVVVGYQNSRIEARFDPSPRDDIRYDFQYIEEVNADSDDEWLDMTVNMVDHYAYSGSLPVNTVFTVRWRSVTSSGRVTAWNDDPTNVGDNLPTVLLGLSVNTNATGSLIVADWNKSLYAVRYLVEVIEVV